MFYVDLKPVRKVQKAVVAPSLAKIVALSFFLPPSSTAIAPSLLVEIDMDPMDCSHESEQVGYCESLVLLDFIRIYICFQADFDYSNVR